MMFKKIFSIVRWFLFAIVLNGFGFITAPILYPLIYPFRNVVRKNKIKTFWYYLDDEDGDFGTEWFRKAKGLKENFKAAYLWSAIRNPAWNMHISVKPEQKPYNLISSKGLLKKNNLAIDIMNFAVLKYVGSNGVYQDNKGEFLSLKHSIIGSSFVWYKSKNKLYFRKSIVKKIKNFWIELQLGTNDNRYTLRFKIKKNLKLYKNG